MTEAMTGELNMLVTVRFPGGGDAAEREGLIREIELATVAKDAGCLRYEWFRSKADAELYYLFERWTSVEAVTAHLAAPHMAPLGRLRALGAEFAVVDLAGV